MPERHGSLPPTVVALALSALVLMVLCGACAAALAQATLDPAKGLLQDSEFDQWRFDPGSARAEVSGGWLIQVRNDKPAFTFASTSVPLPSGAKRLQLEADVSVENGAQGKETWDKPRMHVTFQDTEGAQLGGWPDAGMWTGTRSWFHVSHVFDVPAGAAGVHLYAGIQDSTGAVSFRNVEVFALGQGSAPLAPLPRVSRNDTSNWYPWIDESAPKGSVPTATLPETPATDVSWVLDKPAGKHGFVTATGDSFRFADGTPARFIGVDVPAGNCFPDHATAEALAKRLSAAGVNMVRLHHMDADWAWPNIFGNTGDTRRLNADSLERLDYLVAQLKSRGIYVFLDLLVHRVFGTAEGFAAPIDPGAKIVGQFDPTMVSLEMAYARQLMTHRNAYTHLRYADDPVIALMDVINESSLFWDLEIPARYRTELGAKWNRWLLDRYASRAALAEAWGKQPNPTMLAAVEDPRSGTVAAADLSGSDRRGQDYLRFLYEKQNGYYLEMQAYLRSLGVKVPITGSNHWTRMALDVASNARLDFVDQHGYWNHPQGGYGSDVEFSDAMMVRELGGLVSGLASKRVSGKPYTVTEWQNAWPTEYRAEGMLPVTSYAQLQGWGALLQFDFESPSWADTISGNFDLGNKPELMAQWPLVALSFHRGDVRAGTAPLVASMSGTDLMRGKTVDDTMPAWAPLIDKVGHTFFAPNTVPITGTAPSPVVSHTGELSWNAASGVVTVDTARTKGATGLLGGRSIVLTGATLALTTRFAAVTVTSLTGDAIADSKHLLVSAVARAENTGTVYNSDHTHLVDPGTSPILVEPVEGTIQLARAAGAKGAVYTLDAYGARKGVAKSVTDPATGRFTLCLQASDRSPWYEIVFK